MKDCLSYITDSITKMDKIPYYECALKEFHDTFETSNALYGDILYQGLCSIAEVSVLSI